MLHPGAYFNIQTGAAVISLIGALLVVAVVLFLLATSSTPGDADADRERVYRVRTRYFFGLAAAVVAGLVISLGMLPYPRFQSDPDMTVHVVASQWLWKMAPGEDVPDPARFDGQSTITVPVGRLIRFTVTAVDVNHGFGIYDSDGVLLTQTQAMPGYWNAVQYRFERPGDYSVLCMEYCGAPHSVMRGRIHVE